MTTIKGLRYFYQVDLKGDPIQGSNTRLKRRPLAKGKGQRWVEYIPASEAFPCCEDGGLVVTSIGKPWRFYVRLRTPGIVGELPEPISGTLEKHKNKPKSYGWQEIIGVHQCATQPQFNATYTVASSPVTIDLATLLNINLDHFSFTADSGSTEDDHYDYDIDVDGNLTITTNDADSTDTVTLSYSNGTCAFAFQMTFVAA